METKKLKALVDDEEKIVKIKFDDSEGYIIFEFDDTEIKFDWQPLVDAIREGDIMCDF